MLKLPKSWEADPHKETLLSLLEGSSRALRADGTIKVPHLPLSAGLKTALAFARRCGKMRGGLENIENLLQREETGFSKLAARGQDTRPTAITRVLILSDDGSDRFYRHCEALITRYEPRILCINLEMSSSALGQTFFGKEAVVKALLIEQKEYVQRVLKGLLPAT
jgi:hypothetical protein